MYPELYRKGDYIKGSNVDVPDPYQIGRILEISVRKEFGRHPDPENVKMKVNKFYRYANIYIYNLYKCVNVNDKKRGGNVDKFSLVFRNRQPGHANQSRAKSIIALHKLMTIISEYRIFSRACLFASRVTFLLTVACGCGQ